MLNVTELPDDPALLKRMMTAQMARHAGLMAERDAMIEQIKREAQEHLAAQLAAQLNAQREQMEAEKEAAIKAAVDAVLRRFYGPKSERFDPLQLVLFGIFVDTVPLDAADVASIEAEAGEKLTTRVPRNRHNHGRGKLPEHLPRVRIVHDLTDEQKKCPCCATPRHRIGEEVSEQLEYIPASFKVLQHVRITYACKACEQSVSEQGSQVVTAEKPPQPIEKGLAGPGLLAYIVTGKMADHLPLYRQESIIERNDIHIARSTMGAWMMAVAVLVKPLVELMANRIRQSRVIHTDDTVVPVQHKIQCSKGRFWTHFGDRDHPYIFYDYTPDRSGEGPTRWFADYRGYLQADAYSVYDSLYKRVGADGKRCVIECGCWAHGRRYFFDAKDTDGRRATQLLAMVRDLYAVERTAKDFTDDARLALRQSRSVPILATIKTWLDTERPLVLPRSPMGEAMTYMVNQWEALNVYTTQGFLNIDNNAAERTLKRVALGRRNWQFVGNDRAGKTAATLYSLVASAERHGLDPQRYLTGVFARIASTPVSEVHKLLPDEWKVADAKGA